jgi:hypothetical protein
MSRTLRFFLSLVLAVFTFNQVVLPQVLCNCDKVAMLNPLDNDAEEGFLELNLEWNSPSIYPTTGIFIPFLMEVTDYQSRLIKQSNNTSLHHFGVPIYLDYRVLIV